MVFTKHEKTIRNELLDSLIQNLPCDNNCDECSFAQLEQGYETYEQEVKGCDLVDFLLSKKEV